MNSTQRKKASFIIDDADELLDRVINWSEKHKLFSLHNSNQHFVKYGKYAWLVGAGGQAIYFSNAVFENLHKYHAKHNDWIFGCLPYDLKNNLEDLRSDNPDKIHFPKALFFRPEVVLRFDDKLLFIETLSTNPQEVFSEITASVKPEEKPHETVALQSPYTKGEYISKIEALQKHIQQGDIYEVNFCQEFFAEGVELNSATAYKKLNQRTKAPFSAFLKINQWSVLSGSPERYLAKRENKIISQPIKGTARRAEDRVEDARIKEALLNSKKERAENVMIVDLVRNDLSITAKDNSVEVEELFGVYTFPTVHQLISTVVSEIAEDRNWGEVLKHSFPMGSMTGAPKVSAMNLIEEFEDFKRGIFSGAVGYVSPTGDFDFNVIIRSIIYNSKTKNLSAPVGGAITILSNPEEEYEECLLKVRAIKDSLE